MSYKNPTPIKIRDSAPQKNAEGDYTSLGLEIVNQGSLKADNVLNSLMEVADPEVEVNIVDLGLVYKIVIDKENNIDLDVTLTNPTCPLTETIAENIRSELAKETTGKINVNWVWKPIWDPKRISVEGKEQLAMLGVRF